MSTEFDVVCLCDLIMRIETNLWTHMHTRTFTQTNTRKQFKSAHAYHSINTTDRPNYRHNTVYLIFMIMTSLRMSRI